MRRLHALPILVGLAVGEAMAQQPSPRFALSGAGLRPSLEQQASAALGVIGMMAIPDGTASSISIDNSPGESRELLLGQIGLGFTVSESIPLYLEGFVGYARYDPAFVLSDGTERRRLPLKWNSVSTTLGVGWSFPITDRLQFRPILNGSLGYVATDIALAAELLDWLTGIDIEPLQRGQAAVGGVGGALVLAWYDYRPDAELEIELRYSQMRLETLPAWSRDLSVRSDVGTLGLWTRYRWPSGFEAFGRPMRWVLEGYHSEFLMAQRDALGIDRLTKLGGGIELDTGRWEFGAFGLDLQRVRLMGRAIIGEDVRGWSVGLSISLY